MKTLKYSLFFVGILISVSAFAATLHVDRSNGACGDGSPGNPYKVLQYEKL